MVYLPSCSLFENVGGSAAPESASGYISPSAVNVNRALQQIITVLRASIHDNPFCHTQSTLTLKSVIIYSLINSIIIHVSICEFWLC